MGRCNKGVSILSEELEQDLLHLTAGDEHELEEWLVPCWEHRRWDEVKEEDKEEWLAQEGEDGD